MSNRRGVNNDRSLIPHGVLEHSPCNARSFPLSVHIGPLQDESMGVGYDGEGSGGASGKGAKGTDLEVAIGALDAYCRALLTALPSGVRGVGGARAIITAIPAAARLGWSNLTLSAPELFRTLHGAGLLSHIPGNSDVPAALRLVAAVSGLVTRRSQRRWTVWFACACDPERPLGASIRDSVTRAMLDRESTLRSSASTVSHLAERDRLAEEARASAESQASLLAERDRLAEELRATSESLTSLRGEHAQAVEGLRSANEELASIKVERDQTAEKLFACEDSLARSRDDATRAKSESARLAHERDALKSAASSSKEEVAALQRDLKSESDAHKQELATVRQEQLDARKKAARLARSHAGECAELRERIGALMIKRRAARGPQRENQRGACARVQTTRARRGDRRRRPSAARPPVL